MPQNWSDFWECYIWATASEVLGREAAARGSKGRSSWFNLIKGPQFLLSQLCQWNALNADIHKMCTLLLQFCRSDTLVVNNVFDVWSLTVTIELTSVIASIY
jgi:hypothetical protein